MPDFSHSESPGLNPLDERAFDSSSEISLLVTKIQRLEPLSSAFNRFTAFNVVPLPAKKSSINAFLLSLTIAAIASLSE